MRTLPWRFLVRRREVSASSSPPPPPPPPPPKKKNKTKKSQQKPNKQTEYAYTSAKSWVRHRSHLLLPSSPHLHTQYILNSGPLYSIYLLRTYHCSFCSLSSCLLPEISIPNYTCTFNLFSSVCSPPPLSLSLSLSLSLIPLFAWPSSFLISYFCSISPPH